MKNDGKRDCIVPVVSCKILWDHVYLVASKSLSENLQWQIHRVNLYKIIKFDQTKLYATEENMLVLVFPVVMIKDVALQQEKENIKLLPEFYKQQDC